MYVVTFILTGTRKVYSHTLTVDYYSKYDFGLYECFTVKENKVFKSSYVVNKINYNNDETTIINGEERKLHSVVDDLKIKFVDTSATVDGGFNLTCSYTNAVYNKSMVFWLKDDTLIYVTNPFGEDLAADKSFQGRFNFFLINQPLYRISSRSSRWHKILFIIKSLISGPVIKKPLQKTFHLKYNGELSTKNNGKYSCSVVRDIVPDTPDDVDVKPGPTRFVYVSKNVAVSSFVDGTYKWNFLLINLTGKIFEKFLVFDLKTSKKFYFKR